MSRVGKLPVYIPNGVNVNLNNNQLSISGPKGILTKSFADSMEITLQNNFLFIRPIINSKKVKAIWGTTRSIISNMIKGVTEYFREDLELNGIGYKALIKEKCLTLMLSKSHNTKIIVPDNINVCVPKSNQIVLECIDKEQLGHFVSVIIKQRPVEPYKGKGIKRKYEYVQRKEGKKN